jgi:hypothetical protein
MTGESKLIWAVGLAVTVTSNYKTIINMLTKNVHCEMNGKETSIMGVS